MTIEKGATKRTRDPFFVVLVQYFRILFTVTIVQKVLFWIPPENDIPQSFVKTQKITFYRVVMGAINFNFSILTDVVVNIFWRISAHVDLANQQNKAFCCP